MKLNLEVIVLRGFNYGESDRIIRLLTRENGKVSAIARGARKEKSTLRGAIETATHANFAMSSGRNMFTINQVDVHSIFPRIRNSLEGILAATFICELADEFMEEGHPDEESFQMILEALYSLESNLSFWRKIILYCEVQFHVVNGIFPDFSKCAKCGGSKSAPDVRLDLNNGGALCSNCAEGLQNAQTYPMKALFVLDKASRSDLNSFMGYIENDDFIKIASRIISRFTSHYLGKELKSRAMIDTTFR